MTAYYLQPILPWSGLQEEDRRFRIVLAAVLSVFLVVSYIVPLLPMPEVEDPLETDLPPRLVRVIEDQIEPGAGQPSTQAPVAALPAERETVSVPTPVPDFAREEEPAAAPNTETETAPVLGREASEATTEDEPVAALRPEREPTPGSTPEVDEAAIEAAAREKAASTGLLALSNSLTELRESVPKIAPTEPEAGRGDGAAQAIVRRPSVLTQDIAGVSGGTAGEIVAHQKVLGASSLQPREGTGNRTPLAGSQALAAAREASGVSRANLRSEDEIQEVLDRNKRAMYMIYNRELTRDPKLQGKVVVSITIAPSGKVTKCEIIYSELNATSMEEKLVLLIRRIDFGAKPGIPDVTTRVPIEFFPV